MKNKIKLMAEHLMFFDNKKYFRISQGFLCIGNGGYPKENYSLYFDGVIMDFDTIEELESYVAKITRKGKEILFRRFY